MISSNVLKILHQDILLFNKLQGKSYLIAFASGKNSELMYETIDIHESNFWHLLGCKLDEDNAENKHLTYIKCLNQENISEKVSLIKGYGISEITEKHNAFNLVFDFIKNAKQIKVGYTNGFQEKYINMGIGNMSGIIGYGVKNKNESGNKIPKTAQGKSLTKISKNQYKIIYILSKNISSIKYETLEYEIKCGIYKSIKINQ